MSKPRPGLYDTLITEALSETLATLDRSLEPIRGELRAAEAPDRISLHIARLVARAVASLSESERAKAGLALARRLVTEVHTVVAHADVTPEQLIETGEVLHAIARRMPDGTAELIAGTLIPLLDTTLLTNAPGEPRVGSQLATEIQSADAISIVMAFIRYSGLRPLMDALKKLARPENLCACSRPSIPDQPRRVHSTNLLDSAQPCECPMTRRRHASMPKAGCLSGILDSPPRTLVPRT